MERTRQQNLSKNQDRFLGALLKRLGTERFSRASAEQLMAAVEGLGDTDDTDMVMMYLRGASLTRISEVYGYKAAQVSNTISRVADAIAASEVTVSIEHDVLHESGTEVASTVVQQAIGEGAVGLAIDDNHMPCRMIPDIFFKDSPHYDEARAKAFCNGCDVQGECLENGLKNDLKYSPTDRRYTGIWGGLTPEERNKIHRRNRRAARGL